MCQVLETRRALWLGDLIRGAEWAGELAFKPSEAILVLPSMSGQRIILVLALLPPCGGGKWVGVTLSGFEPWLRYLRTVNTPAAQWRCRHLPCACASPPVCLSFHRYKYTHAFSRFRKRFNPLPALNNHSSMTTPKQARRLMRSRCVSEQADFSEPKTTSGRPRPIPTDSPETRFCMARGRHWLILCRGQGARLSV